jgi:large conductance mechanosensitive channel
MWNDFKAFIMRGNVIDMAVGVIIGAAFSGIVTSLVNDVLMPPLGLLMKGVDFTNLFFTLKPLGGTFDTLQAAKDAGAVTLNVGLFANTVINFIIVAAAVFGMIQGINRLKPPPPKESPSTKDCPFCFTTIHIKATRCPNCTSELKK